MSDDHICVTCDRPSSDITFIKEKKVNYKYMTSSLLMCLLNYHHLCLSIIFKIGQC